MYPYVEDAVLYEIPLGHRIFLANHNKKMKINKNVETILSFCNGTTDEEGVVEKIIREMGSSPEEARESYRKISEIFSEKGVLKYSDTPQAHTPVHRPRILNPPFEMAYLELTYRCNLQCEHCYNAAGDTRELRTQEWKKVIDELFDCGCLRIFLTGGEPLLHEGFIDILEYARSKYTAVGVLTNGVLLDDETAEKMKRRGVTSVHFSLDGPTASIHDEFRGLKGSFEKTRAAVQLALSKGLRVKVTTCIHRKNLEEGMNLVNLMDTLGITEYNFAPVIKSFRKEENAVTPEEFVEFLKMLPQKEQATVYAPQYVKNCGIGYKECVIHPDGTVGLCTPFGAEGPVLGDLKTEEFIDIWNAPFLQELRTINAFNHEKCGKCPHVEYCLGGCMANTYYATGVITCGSPYVCANYCVLSSSPSFDIIKLEETL